VALLYAALVATHLASFVYDLVADARTPFAAFYDAALVSVWTIALVRVFRHAGRSWGISLLSQLPVFNSHPPACRTAAFEQGPAVLPLSCRWWRGSAGSIAWCCGGAS